MSVNDDLQDASVRNAVYIHRFGGGTARRVVDLLNKVDGDMVDKIRSRLAAIEERGFDPGPRTTQRLQRLLDEVRVQQRDLYKAVGKQLRDDLRDLAEAEIEITARHLSLEGPAGDTEALAPGAPSQAVDSLAEVERRAILDALRVCDGNRSEAARRLGIDRSTLRRKLREYQLPGTD